ncbi:alpha/beta fold hydrolase [Nocardia goodfellowii]
MTSQRDGYAASPTPGSDMKLVDIGGYRLATYVAGEGIPPVVFIAEYTGAASIWDGVRAEMQQPCMTFTYDRPGLGNSDDLPGDERARPRTWGQSAEELHRLLTLLNIESPRVVVGHSYGSLIARAYVEQWPTDVAGLVLSETSDPNLYEDGSFPDWMHYEDDNGRAGTRFDVLTGSKEDRSLRPRPDLPTVVVTGAVGRWERAIGKLDEYSGKTWQEIDDLWQANQRAIAHQAQAAQIIAHAAGHQLCVEAPALIARAVDAVFAAVRTGTDIRLDPTAVEDAGGRVVHHT